MPNTIRSKERTSQGAKRDTVTRPIDAARGPQASDEVAAARVKSGGNNIFAEIGLPNPEVQLLKTEISMRIEELIDAKGLTQEQAARCMGITQPDVSENVNVWRNRFAYCVQLFGD